MPIKESGSKRLQSVDGGKGTSLIFFFFGTIFLSLNQKCLFCTCLILWGLIIRPENTIAPLLLMVSIGCTYLFLYSLASTTPRVLNSFKFSCLQFCLCSNISYSESKFQLYTFIHSESFYLGHSDIAFSLRLEKGLQICTGYQNKDTNMFLFSPTFSLKYSKKEIRAFLVRRSCPSLEDLYI